MSASPVEVPAALAARGVVARKGGRKVYVQLVSPKKCYCGKRTWIKAPVEDITRVITNVATPEEAFAALPKWKVREFTSGYHRDCERVLEGKAAV